MPPGFLFQYIGEFCVPLVVACLVGSFRLGLLTEHVFLLMNSGGVFLIIGVRIIDFKLVFLGCGYEWVLARLCAITP